MAILFHPNIHCGVRPMKELLRVGIKKKAGQSFPRRAEGCRSICKREKKG
jgi:hypothetical protein